jgi:hypothetical protein
MIERIDFALEPGVILFAVLFFVLINALIAAAVYPYFQRDGASDEARTADLSRDTKDFVQGPPSDPKVLEQRVDEFIADMEESSNE